MSLKSVKMHKYNAETLENKQSKANLPKHTVSYLSLGSYNELRLYYTRNKKEKKNRTPASTFTLWILSEKHSVHEVCQVLVRST